MRNDAEFFRRMSAKRAQETQARATEAGKPEQGAVANGQAFPIDRFGHPLRPGDLVTYRPPLDLVFEVKDVKPEMDPRAPQGVVRLVLAVTLPMHAMLNQPVAEMIRIGHVQAETTTTPQAVENVPVREATDPVDERESSSLAGDMGSVAGSTPAPAPRSPSIEEVS